MHGVACCVLCVVVLCVVCCLLVWLLVVVLLFLCGWCVLRGVCCLMFEVRWLVCIVCCSLYVGVVVVRSSVMLCVDAWCNALLRDAVYCRVLLFIDMCCCVVSAVCRLLVGCCNCCVVCVVS